MRWLNWIKARLQTGGSNGTAYPWAESRNIVSQRMHRARKTYECALCGAVVSVGDQYARTTYVEAGKLTVSVACHACGASRGFARVKWGAL